MLKQKILPQCESTALSINPSHSYTLNVVFYLSKAPLLVLKYGMCYPTEKANEEI
jgi:hypothetical protein